MPNPYARRQQDLRREQERRRRSKLQTGRNDQSPNKSGRAPGAAPVEHRRAAATECGWCFGPITPKARGPVPKWCSASCRQRAWEQRRAAASGLSAVEVVERVVEVPVPTPAPAKPRNQEWQSLLRELARQLDKQLVYDRHLAGIAEDVHKVVAALGRRSGWVPNGGSYQRADGEPSMSPRSPTNTTWTSPRLNRQ